jgi:hypothetical protein
VATTRSARGARSERTTRSERSERAERARREEEPVEIPPETRSERESTELALRETRARERDQAGGPLAYLWANYNLTIVMIVVTLVALLLHGVFGWMQYSADQVSHGQTPELWGPDGYWIYFGEWTFQNWQSEFLEVLVMISFTSWFVHRGSPESKDGQQETTLALSRIEKRLERMERAAR